MEWLENLGLAIGGGLVGAVLRPWVERVLPMPGRAKRVRLAVQRAWTDHQTWIANNERARNEEIRQADEDLNERGMLQSGLRGQAHERIRAKYVAALKEDQRQLIRKAEDAFAELGPLEERRVKRQLRKTGTDFESLEARLVHGSDGTQQSAG